MKPHYHKQAQFELFPGAVGDVSPQVKNPWVLPFLRLSVENVVILTVFIVVSMVVSFSLGVEKGKRILAYETVKRSISPTRRTNKQNLLAEEISVPPAAVTAETAQAAEIAEPVETTEIKTATIALPDLPAPESETLTVTSPEPEPIPENVYTIQVASFERETTAQQEAEALKKKGFEILVVPKGEHSIVCVGKFAERKDAQAFSQKIKSRYKDYIIRRL